MHRIDPRIVIIQIVLSGICAFWIFKPLAMLCEVIFLMSFLLYLQHPKEALRLGVWFAFLVGLYALLNESNRLNCGNVPCRGCVLYPHKNTEQQSIYRE